MAHLPPAPCARLQWLLEAVAREGAWGDLSLRSKWPTAAAVLLLDALQGSQEYSGRGTVVARWCKCMVACGWGWRVGGVACGWGIDACFDGYNMHPEFGFIF